MLTIKYRLKKKYASMKHAADTLNHLRSIELQQNKCVDKFAGKSTWYTFWERVFEAVATAKIYLENLLVLIEEIGYFTFSNNNDVVSSNEVLPNSIFDFDDVAWHARRGVIYSWCSYKYVLDISKIHILTYIDLSSFISNFHISIAIRFSERISTVKVWFRDHYLYTISPILTRYE